MTDQKDVSCHPTGSARSLWGMWWILGAAVAVVVLFYRLGDLPIQVWDEARLANNALEMSQTGLSLVTTYDGQPDHWNTKPPLVIWTMVLSIREFGPIEWSVRLPSAIAGLLTVVVVFGFCAARLRRPVAAFAAVLVILSSPGYVQGTDFWTNPGELLQGHAARSGNYDAVLALFTTVYLIAAYLALSDRAAIRWRWLLVCCVGILLAFMTKTVQGLIFLPALAVYAAAKGHLGRLARSWQAWLCLASLLLVCLGYYFARELLDPGYVRNALIYDFGRYGSVSDGHDGSPFYYLTQYRLFPALLPFLAIGALQALFDSGERRNLSAYLALASAIYLTIISLSATKLWWYAIPLVPLSGIALAVSLDFAADRLAARPALRRLRRSAAVTFTLCAAIGLLIIFRNLQLEEMGRATAESRRLDRYSYFLRGPINAATGIRKFVVLHPGYSRDEYYVAPVLFYVNVLRSQGRAIVIQHPKDPIPPGFDTVVVCPGAIGRAELGLLKLVPILEATGCGAYRTI